MTDIADKIYAATGLTLGAEAAPKVGHMIRLARQEAADENEKLRAALQWLLNDLQDYPASARPIAAYDNARAALGEKE
jgi:hypothetical protein